MQLDLPCLCLCLQLALISRLDYTVQYFEPYRFDLQYSTVCTRICVKLTSSILLNLSPARKLPLNLVGKSKVPARLWEGERPRGTPPSTTRDHPTTESDVVVDWGELLAGVIDKAHVGLLFSFSTQYL